jgi:hypothetical protein
MAKMMKYHRRRHHHDTRTFSFPTSKPSKGFIKYIAIFIDSGNSQISVVTTMKGCFDGHTRTTQPATKDRRLLIFLRAENGFKISSIQTGEKKEYLYIQNLDG